jgi:uncharacterized protein with FMN-binding domain
MGIITGYICLVLLVLLLIKGLFYKTKVNRILKKIHKPVTYILLCLTIIHFILVLPVLKQRNVFLFISGIVIIVLLIALVILWHLLKKKMKTHIIISIVVLLFMVAHMIVYFIDFGNYQKKINEIEIKDIDITNVQDGKYIGEYDAGYIYAKVSVEIKNHKIEDIIILEHLTERGKKAEVIINDVLRTQTLDDEVISGATNSSLVIKKAIENAINGR